MACLAMRTKAGADHLGKVALAHGSPLRIGPPEAEPTAADQSAGGRELGVGMLFAQAGKRSVGGLAGNTLASERGADHRLRAALAARLLAFMAA